MSFYKAHFPLVEYEASTVLLMLSSFVPLRAFNKFIIDCKLQNIVNYKKIIRKSVKAAAKPL